MEKAAEEDDSGRFVLALDNSLRSNVASTVLPAADPPSTNSKRTAESSSSSKEELVRRISTE